ncbi:hypothetical protein BOX15_Mlig018466g1, partial [Macrostomum lignano]
ICRSACSLLKQLPPVIGMASSPIGTCTTASSLTQSISCVGCTELVKSDFNHTVQLKALPVPTAKLKSCIGTLKKLMPSFVKLASIVEGPDAGTKLALMDPKLLDRRQSLLNQAELAHLAEFGVNLGDNLQADQLETRTVAVTYEHYSLSAVLDRLLPPNTQLSSFSVVGHIAHFNLKEEVLPYGQLIGQVVISKLPNIRTVVNKRSQINNEYRNFELELLAGEPNYVTLHKEYGLEFELDFSKVYWNSRLSTEHHRVVEQLRPGDLVFDLCAGVGPFAVPALKLGATVFANDLNPTAHNYLEANLRRNLRKSQLISQPELVKAFNMDAREFVAGVLAPRYAEAVASGFEQQVVAIANLPGMAVDLLDCFVGCVKELLTPEVAKSAPPVRIFAYSFLRHGDTGGSRGEAEAALIGRICDRLAGGVQPCDIRLRFVRDVATNKDMYCAEIRCPASLLAASSCCRPSAVCDGIDDQTASKKPRLA